MKTSTIAILYLFLSILCLSNTRAQILHLSVMGQDSLQTMVIDSLDYQKTFPDFVSMKNQIDSLQKKIERLGYIENRRLYTRKNNDSTYVSKFDLNKKYYTIYIYYPKNLVSSDILEQVSDKVDDQYFVSSISKIEEVLKFINSKMIEQGDPFSSLKLVNIKKRDANSIRADLKTSYKNLRHIDEIVIKGYEKFPRPFIKRFLRIKNGDPFNLEAIKIKAEELNDLSFARQARPPEVLFTKDSTSLYLYLEKTRSNTFDGFLGFGTNESTNKIEFDGYLDLRLVNNLNYGESFSLNYKSDENEQKTFEANLSLPYILRSAVGTEISLSIFKKDSTFTTVDQSLSLFYQINARQKAFVGINAIESNNLLDNDMASSVEDYNSLFYTLRYEFIKRQDPNLLFPVNFFLDIQAGFGKRDFADLTEDQTIFNLNSFKIFSLNQKNSLYLRVNAAGINTENYLTNELLRFGGIRSIRGFEENSLFASMYGLVNTEYRYNLSNTMYIHSIFDAAYFENELTLSKKKLFAFGFGFGIYTRSGLLRFNYANGKPEDKKFKLSDSKVHLSLSALF